MKKIYLIHGWDGYPENCWFPWLKNELESRGFEVFVPAMPGTEKPVKSVWLEAMRNIVSNPDQDTYFVGHSMGCQAIQRYLEQLPEEIIIKGSVFVAGWIDHPHWEDRTEEELEVVNDWFQVPKDYEKIKNHCKNFVSIFSDNDPFISQDNWEQAKEKLNSKNIILSKMGHFDDYENKTELPEALNAILNF